MSGRVGYRFHPTDEELVSYFLHNKIQGNGFRVDDDIHLVDICKFDPWDLPGFSSQGSDDQQWYFFYKREPKYKNTSKICYNRSTKSGNWKPTGEKRVVKAKRTNKVIGIKRTLVFYLRPSQVKTNWVIHEYEPKPGPPHQADLVLCKLKEKADKKADSSGCEDGDSAGNGASAFENNRIEIPVSEVDQEVLLESILAAGQGVNFRDPSREQQSQFLIEEGISIEDLMLTDDVFDIGSNGTANQWNTIEEDPYEIADGFLDLQDQYGDGNCIYALTLDHSGYIRDDSARTHRNSSSCSQQSMSGLYLDDIDDMDAEIVVGRSLQSGASNSNIKQRNTYRQTHRVQTLTETLPPSRYEQNPTAKNHVRRDDVLVMEDSSADSTTYFADEIKRVGVASKEHPIHVTQILSRSGNRVQIPGNFSSSPNQMAKETRKHVNEVNLPQKSLKGLITVKTEKDKKVIGAKTSLKIRPNQMEGNKTTGSFILMETSPLSRRQDPPSVYIVNVCISLVLLIAAIREMLVLG